MATLVEARKRFADHANCTIVSADEFVKMMISRTAFQRADEPDANLMGLIDEQTGNRILVKIEELNQVHPVAVQLN